MALLRPVASVRVIAAELILGVALAGALVLYSHPHRSVPCYKGAPGHSGCTEMLGWIAPTALGIAILGVAVAGGVLAMARRSSK